MKSSPPTMGSGGPSSGHTCNREVKVHLLPRRKHIFTRGGSSYLSQTEQWWHRSGFSNWQRSQKRMAEETHTQVSGRALPTPDPPLPDHMTSLLCEGATSRVGAGVDGQLLGYPPQDLLLGLLPIFPLQQLFVSVGQVELWGAEHTNNA